MSFIQKISLLAFLFTTHFLNAQVSFTPSQTSGCAPFSINFFNETSLNGTDTTGYTFYWSYGGGYQDTAYHASHTFYIPGDYQIELFADSAGFFKGNFFANIHVDGIAITSPIENAEFCPGEEIYFQANVQIPIDSMHWDFGNGDINNWQNVNYTYSDTGTYNVAFVYYSNFCASDTLWRTIHINENVQPSFQIYANNWNVCPNDPIDFGVNTQGNNYLWTFGNGDSSFTSSASTSYDSVGNYTIILALTNLCGQTGYDTTGVQVDSAIFPNANNISGFNNAVCPSDVVSITSFASGTYHWNMGDGNIYTTKEIQHTYADTGNYAIKLIVVNACGNSDTATFFITVQYNPGQNPNAQFSFQDVQFGIDTLNVCPGTTIGFNNNTWVGEIHHLLWVFGDGDSSSDYSPQHTFNADGFFEVKLYITNNCGGIDSATKYVHVDSNMPPMANLNYLPPMICPGENVYFFDDGDDDDLVYDIWFGTGDSLMGLPREDPNSPIGVTAFYTYSDTGIYTIKFKATNTCGNSDSIEGDIMVNLNNNNPFFFVQNSSPSSEACPGDLVEFMAVGGLQAVWNFNDGNPADTGMVITHAFDSVGVYMVDLIITDGCGNDSAMVVNVEIGNQNIPNANFWTNVPGNKICLGDSITFFPDGNWNNALHFDWDFDDGYMAMGDEVTHTFTSAGYFDVQLTTSNGCGNNTYTQTIEVVALEIDETSIAINNTNCVAPTGNISGITVSGNGPLFYNWMNAGFNSVGNNLNISSIGAGNYYFQVSNNLGCNATSGPYLVENLGAPIAPTLTTTLNYCDGDTTETLSVTPNSGGFISLYSDITLLNLMDTGNTLNPEITTSATVYLTETASGCQSVATAVVYTFYPNHTTTLNLAICDGDSVLLEGMYQTSAGTYYDTLQSIHFCDSIIKSVLIINPVQYTADSVNICYGDSIYLQGAYQYTDGYYNDTFSNGFGCDSIVTTALHILPQDSSQSTQSICDNDSLLVGGAYQNTAGTYYDVFSGIDGCDSVHATLLEIKPTYYSALAFSVCQNDSVLIAGHYYMAGGFYYDSLTTAQGCDSVMGYDLGAILTLYDTSEVVICNGDSAILHGQYQSTTGFYADTLTSSITSCDSISVYALNVLSTTFSNVSDSICQGDSIMIGTTYWYTAGSYNDTLSNQYGCDSIVITDLSIMDIDSTMIAFSICNGDSALLGGLYRTTAGIYYDFLSGSNSCDSIVKTTLGINPIFAPTLAFSICEYDSFLVGSTYYPAGGLYYDSLITIDGCDSIIGYDVTAIPTLYDTLVEGICSGDSLMIFGLYQNTSGYYSDTTISNISSCDSITTIQLVVQSLMTYNYTDSICPGDSIYLQGAYQTMAGVYTDTFSTIYGCDSVVHLSLGIDYTIVNAGADSSYTLCQDSAWLNLSPFLTGDAGGYWFETTAPTGKLSGDSLNIVSSGTYQLAYSLNRLCDKDTAYFTILVEAKPIVGTAFNDTICDSLETYNLAHAMVFPVSGGYWYFNGDSLGGGGVDVNMLIDPAVYGKGTYTYAYTMPSGNTCDDETTSAAIIIIECIDTIATALNETVKTTAELLAFPNPAHEKITISWEGMEFFQLSIFDINGRLVYTDKTNGNNYSINTKKWATGIYTIKAISKDKIAVKEVQVVH